METALENLSKEDLLKVISSRDQALSERDEKIGYLESQLAMYKRMQFGQKRERFEGDPNQTALPFEAPPEELEQQQEHLVAHRVHRYHRSRRRRNRGAGAAAARG